MKKLLLTAAVLAMFASPAQTAGTSLPSIYLGRWCNANGEGFTITAEWPGDGAECKDSNYLIVRHNSIEARDFRCNFRSVKPTGKRWPISTKPGKDDWVPVMYVSARCNNPDEDFHNQDFELSYGKGGYIHIDFKRTRK
jgi:hypothetical protein